MNQIISQLTEFFLQYSIRQRMIIFAVLIGFLSAVVSLVLWANRTEYDLLYSNLDPTAASSIVDDLRNSKIKFRLDNGGTSVLVPKDQVAELRLKYVQTGYLSDSVSGYELFEKNNMGMTTFMQHLNLKRALEGELTRTINQFPEVKQSRVHLVVPEDRLFEDQKSGSASIVLHMVPGASLNHNQINGIAALVANSVEGIESEDVVVMDSQGNVLIEGPKDTGQMGQVGNQYDLKRSIEKEFQDKVTEIVEGIVGKKNAVVQVSTELNFDQVERTLEEIDPENVAIVSEQKYTETSTNKTDSSDMVVENLGTNYEFSKKYEKFISNTGGIKRLTVAVLVNGNYITQENEEGEAVQEYFPRSDQELGQIAALVRSAVGYSEERGDIVEVQNMKLVNGNGVITSNEEYFSDGLPMDFWMNLINYILIGLGLLFGFYLLKGLLKSSVTQFGLPAPAGTPALNQPNASRRSFAEEEVSEDIYMKKLSPEARAKLRAKDRMTEEVIAFAEESPENATNLVRSWLTQQREA
ncbi:MAG: flagellar M-ring protein FliF [Ignavibacteria bacterium]|nr:flagellar M-ring protein FliF [Ignavibacteria bacterium]